LPVCLTGVVLRAKEVLSNLEKEELNETGTPKLASRKTKKRKEQLDLFSSVKDSVADEILALDLENFTPEEAFKTLVEFKNRIKF